MTTMLLPTRKAAPNMVYILMPCVLVLLKQPAATRQTAMRARVHSNVNHRLRAPVLMPACKACSLQPRLVVKYAWNMMDAAAVEYCMDLTANKRPFSSRHREQLCALGIGMKGCMAHLRR